MTRRRSFTLYTLAMLALLAAPLAASSHREAPFITENPKVDGTDFYMFRSYESGRDGFVTLLANYVPLQDPFGGPNYFTLDPNALYMIHVDNSGDGVEDVSFVFQVEQTLEDLQIPVGGESVSVPLVNIGIVDLDSSAQNIRESYKVFLVRGPIDGPSSVRALRNASTRRLTFAKPLDNVGNKSFDDYETYANAHIYDVTIPGCADGRVFVGQRKESFAVNLGEIFDLVNIEMPLGPVDAEPSATENKNITTFALEIPTACLAGGGEVIGGWMTAHLPRVRVLKEEPSFDTPELALGNLIQVSRLGMPLVNELVIGLKDKNRFNESRPADDLQFATYVTNPTLPELIELLFSTPAPNNFPRTDLLNTFVLGIDGLNLFGFGEMQRLNVTLPITPAGSQSNLGVIGGDLGGFPNGRRPGDDVVDIELRVAMGLLCHAFPGLYCNPGDAPSGLLEFTDGAIQEASQFLDEFPYLTTPIPGSGNGVNGLPGGIFD